MLSHVASGRFQAWVWLLGEKCRENGYHNLFGSRYFSLLGVWSKYLGIPKSRSRQQLFSQMISHVICISQGPVRNKQYTQTEQLEEILMKDGIKMWARFRETSDGWCSILELVTAGTMTTSRPEGQGERAVTTCRESYSSRRQPPGRSRGLRKREAINQS